MVSIISPTLLGLPKGNALLHYSYPLLCSGMDNREVKLFLLGSLVARPLGGSIFWYCPQYVESKEYVQGYNHHTLLGGDCLSDLYIVIP